MRSHTAVARVKHLDASNLETSKYIRYMIERRAKSEAVCAKGNIYVFSGQDSDKKY